MCLGASFQGPLSGHASWLSSKVRCSMRKSLFPVSCSLIYHMGCLPPASASRMQILNLVPLHLAYSILFGLFKVRSQSIVKPCLELSLQSQTHDPPWLSLPGAGLKGTLPRPSHTKSFFLLFCTSCCLWEFSGFFWSGWMRGSLLFLMASLHLKAGQV